MLDNQEVFAYALLMSKYRAAGVCSICLVKARQLSALLDMANLNRFIKLSSVACFKYFIYICNTLLPNLDRYCSAPSYGFIRASMIIIFVLSSQIDNTLVMAELF